MKKYFILGLVLISFQVFAANNKTISVVGECQKDVISDRGQISITAENMNAEINVASKKSTEQIEKLKQSIKALNLKDLEIESTEYSVNEEFDWQSKVRKSLGFKVRLGIKISTSDISKLGEVLKLAAQYKLQNAGSLETFLSAQKRKSEYEACLEVASQNARSKALKIAKGLGLEVASVLSVSESIASPNIGPRPMMMEMRSFSKSAEMDAGSAPQVDAAKANVGVRVEATFLIK